MKRAERAAYSFPICNAIRRPRRIGITKPHHKHPVISEKKDRGFGPKGGFLSMSGTFTSSDSGTHFLSSDWVCGSALLSGSAPPGIPNERCLVLEELQKSSRSLGNLRQRTALTRFLVNDTKVLSLRGYRKSSLRRSGSGDSDAR